MTTKRQWWTLDRFEGEVAILINDNGGTVYVGRSDLPDGSVEGVVLSVPIAQDGSHDLSKAEIEHDSTSERRQQAHDLLEELRERKSGRTLDG